MRLFEITEPLNLDKNEIALMTLDEFLKYRNPEGKMHPSDAYKYDVEKLNRDYSLKTKYFRNLIFKYNNSGVIFYEDDNPVAVYDGNTLYYTNQFDKNQVPFSYEDLVVRPKNLKPIKYINDYISKVSDLSKKNLEQYNNLIQRFKNGNEYFTIRSEKPLKENDGETIAILNSENKLIGFASDEWGATLITISDEYKRRGLGQILTKFWYKNNPKYLSGGFTESGVNNAMKAWSNRVREFLSKGWYSELIKNGLLSKEKLSEILSDILPRSKSYSEKIKNKKPLILSDDNMFVIYDIDFFSNPLEENVYAHGFFRQDSHERDYIFTLDYDPEFKTLATNIIFQIARDEDFKVYVKSPPSDHLELDGINIKKDGDYVYLEKDVINLKLLSKYEKSIRKSLDKYDEGYYQLLEIANSKWK